MGEARTALGYGCLDVHLEAAVSRIRHCVDPFGKKGALIPLPSLGEEAACVYLAQASLCGFLQIEPGLQSYRGIVLPARGFVCRK